MRALMLPKIRTPDDAELVQLVETALSSISLSLERYIATGYNRCISPDRVRILVHEQIARTAATTRPECIFFAIVVILHELAHSIRSSLVNKGTKATRTSTWPYFEELQNVTMHWDEAGFTLEQVLFGGLLGVQFHNGKHEDVLQSFFDINFADINQFFLLTENGEKYRICEWLVLNVGVFSEYSLQASDCIRERMSSLDDLLCPFATEDLHQEELGEDDWSRLRAVLNNSHLPRRKGDMTHPDEDCGVTVMSLRHAAFDKYCTEHPENVAAVEPTPNVPVCVSEPGQQKLSRGRPGCLRQRRQPAPTGKLWDRTHRSSFLTRTQSQSCGHDCSTPE